MADVTRSALLSALPLLAGAALLAATAATGPLAIVIGILGGSLVGGSLIAPFVARNDDDPPESICPPESPVISDDEAEAVADVIQPVTATAAATAVAKVASPTGQWIERTAARTATAKRR